MIDLAQPITTEQLERAIKFGSFREVLTVSKIISRSSFRLSARQCLSQKGRLAVSGPQEGRFARKTNKGLRRRHADP